MARSPTFGEGLGLDVHARTQIIAGSWSLVSNAVVRIGDDIFEVANNGEHFLNGIRGIELPSVMSGRYQISKTEEILEGNEDDTEDASTFLRTWYTIELDNGEKISITNFRTMLSINVNANLRDTVGMLGSSVSSGLVGRDGNTIEVGRSDEMGLQWQVQNTEPMLFNEIRAPQFPETCVLPMVNTSRRLRQSEKMYQQAKVACTGLEGEIQKFCIEDVILTGDVAVSKGYGSVF
jgi:hypothetical protein